MTKIKPISIWQNGKIILFDNIAIQINFDDLKSRAIFYYTLQNEENLAIDGSIQIDGEEYKKWTGENEETINIVITKLGLSLS